MSLKREYDHSNLSLSELHKSGIRSTGELEEVIEGVSVCEINDELLDFPVYIFTGFTSKTRGLKIALTFDSSGRYVTLDVTIPTPREFLKKICK